ncbi:MAG TPA: DUF5939 domain-containing protein, partial [Roseiflexaceae bacterium]|nr:DUF5939 domain-containing protein [Roseiflexaceae bacterium]
SDTDRVNRLLGLPASEQIQPNEDLSRTISGHFLGVPVTWREYPFEWIFEQWFEVTRVFEPPFPVETLITRTVLTPLDARRTHAEVQVRMTARNIIGSGPARWFVEGKFLRDMRRVYRQFGQFAHEASIYVPPPPLRKPAVNQARLKAGTQRLRQAGIQPALIARLTAYLSEADDPDVVKIRPFVLADRWGVGRLDVLRMFLYATRAGLLDLEWDVICPGCRGASERHAQLSDIRNEAHCPSCLIRYDVDFEESVELRFSVSPDIRTAADLVFCVGGPASTRHIMMQVWLDPGEQRDLAIRLEPGMYRLRSQQVIERNQLEVSDAAGDYHAAITLDEQAFRVEGGPLGSGESILHL